MPLSHKQSVLFDLDGTLVDSIGLIVFCFQESFRHCLGVSISKEEVLEKIGKPLRPQLEQMATQYGFPGHGMKVLETYREIQFGNHNNLVTVFPGVVDSLLFLSEADVKLGLVTSKGRGGTDAALELLGKAKDVFSVVVTADDSLTHKPDAGPLLQAAKSIKIVPEHCCYVGDTVFDMQAAVAAKMTPVGVLWGVADRATLANYTNYLLEELPFTSQLWRR